MCSGVRDDVVVCCMAAWSGQAAAAGSKQLVSPAAAFPPKSRSGKRLASADARKAVGGIRVDTRHFDIVLGVHGWYSAATPSCPDAGCV